MEDRKCPHCGAAMVGAMKFCAACGKRADGTDAVPPVQKQKSSDAGKVIIILGGVALTLMVLVALVGGGGRGRASSPPGGAGADSIGAWVVCKDFVTQRLKAPSTATFPASNSDGVTITKLDSVQFRVNAYVDSQNSFGAMIRTQYSCTVRHTGGDNWRLEGLTTD